jgi:hypothetical protein
MGWIMLVFLRYPNPQLKNKPFDKKDMECELCGREYLCKPATIDGVKMMLCPNR